MNMIKRFTKKDIVSIAVLSVIFIALIIRSFYGLDIGDESFYYALAKKFSDGYIPIVDEYNPAQLFAVVLIPLYRIYAFFVPDLAGIILAGRICQAFFMYLGALYVYKHLRRYRVSVALLSASLFMCCKVSRIFGLGYYNMYIFFLVIGAILLAEGGRFKSVLSGLCFFVCVLCMPFSIVAVLLTGIHCFKNGKKKDYLYMIGAGFVCVVLFLIYMFCKTDLISMIRSVPYITKYSKVTSYDIESSSSSVYDIWYVMFSYFIMNAFIDILFIILLSFIKKLSSLNFLKIFFIDWTVGTVLSICFNLILLPDAMYVKLTFMGLYVLYRFPEVRKNTEGVFFLIFGCMMSLMFMVGTSFVPACICTGMCLSVIGSLMLIGDLAVDTKSVKWFHMNAAACFAFTIVFSFLLRSYADSTYDKLTERIDFGPGAGLYVSDVSYDQNAELFAIKNIIDKSSDENGDIAISRRYPYAYLVFNREINCPSTWDIPLDNTRQLFYYNYCDSVYRSKHDLPEIFVLFSEDSGLKLCDSDNYEMMNGKNPRTGWVYEQLEADYDSYDHNGTKIYIKRGVNDEAYREEDDCSNAGSQ